MTCPGTSTFLCARMKLSTLGLSIDALSREQEQYLAGTGE